MPVMDETAIDWTPQANSPRALLAASMLRDEYLEAFLSGDAEAEVSTPGYSRPTARLIDLVLSLADMQAALAAQQGAL